MARIVFVTGDKGGVGKSFLARTLMDWYGRTGVDVKAFDTDKTNSTFYRFFRGQENVAQLDVDAVEDLDQLLNVVSVKTNGVILVDCAARTMDQLLSWMRDVDFAGMKTELGFQMTIAFVMGPEKDCVAILRDLVEEMKGSADYVIIRNRAKGRSFDIYDNSAIRKSLNELYKASEIDLPAMFEKTALTVDRLNVNFEKALEHKEVQIADRQRIKIYRDKTRAMFEQGVAQWM